MSVIKTQIYRTPPPRSAKLCPCISLTYLFILPLNLNMPSLITENCTPLLPPLSHAAAPCRRHLARHCHTPLPHALCRRHGMTTAGRVPQAACLQPSPPPYKHRTRRRTAMPDPSTATSPPLYCPPPPHQPPPRHRRGGGRYQCGADPPSVLPDCRRQSGRLGWQCRQMCLSAKPLK